MNAVPFVISIGRHCQLLAQGKHLEMKRGAAPQEVDQGCEGRNDYRFHAGNATWAPTEKSTKSTSMEFLVGTAPGTMTHSTLWGAVTLYDLGFFDEDVGRVEPTTNPFVPEL
jgi:hypothetical protein